MGCHCARRGGENRSEREKGGFFLSHSFCQVSELMRAVVLSGGSDPYPVPRRHERVQDLDFRGRDLEIEERTVKVRMSVFCFVLFCFFL